MERLNISKQSIPADRDVNRWPHLNRIEIPEIENKGGRGSDYSLDATHLKLFGFSKRDVVIKVIQWVFDRY